MIKLNKNACELGVNIKGAAQLTNKENQIVMFPFQFAYKLIEQYPWDYIRVTCGMDKINNFLNCDIRGSHA